MLLAAEAASAMDAYQPPSSPLWFYSQNLYDSRTHNFITQDKLKYRLLSLDPNTQLYVGAYLTKDARTDTNLIYNDNYVAPLVGIGTRWPRLNMGAFADLMVAFRTASSKMDFRLAIYHYDFRNLGNSQHWFFETYSDLSHLHNFSENIFFQHWTKLGWRWRLSENHWRMDLFPELVANKDVLGWPYSNFLDIRMGARVDYTRSSNLLSLIVTRGTGLYDGDRTFYSPIKVLVVVGIGLD